MSTALERWSWLTAEANGRGVVGQPGIRDPEHPCAHFVPGEPSHINECEGDSHYMCKECLHLLVCDICGERPIQCECSDEVVESRGELTGWLRVITV